MREARRYAQQRALARQRAEHGVMPRAMQNALSAMFVFSLISCLFCFATILIAV